MNQSRPFGLILGIWSFVAGAIVLFVALWLLDLSPRQLTGERAVLNNGPMWHEYQPAAGNSATMATVAEAVQEDRGNAITTAVRRVSPAVVSIGIIVERRYLRDGYNDYFDYFFDRYGDTGRTIQQVHPKVGTGFIIDANGTIVTNQHVIEGGSRIIVTLQDGREFEGNLIGADASLDIAVIRIQGSGLPFAMLGNSDGITIGEWAIAIGNPFASLLQDNQPTVTVGVISAVNRQFIGSAEEGRYYQNMIQTDAAINPGNSGGPLLNARGEVIGINTFIFTKSGGSIGLGFARPINEVKRLVQEILTYGGVREITLGFRGREVSPMVARALNLPSAEGVIVQYVADGGPAAVSGLQRGDVILRMDGIPVRSAADANAKIRSLKVGDILTLDIYRDGRAMQVKIRAAQAR